METILLYGGAALCALCLLGGLLVCLLCASGKKALEKRLEQDYGKRADRKRG